LPHADLLVAVSAGVRNSFTTAGKYCGEVLLLENGCDFDFWAERPFGAPVMAAQKIAFYQGGINRRLDGSLLSQVVDPLPSWQFWFCGRQEGVPEFTELCQRANVRYFGAQSPEGVRELARQSMVGLIPFVREPYIDISMPLKAFEYVACDLPVVSVPIDAL